MKNIFLALIIVSFSVISLSQESSSSTTASSAGSGSSLKMETPKKQKDIDDEITNSYLRAKSGKKSNYSFYSDLTYSGGSIEKPLGKESPALMSGVLHENKTKLSGNMSFKARLSPASSINIGSGVGLTTPGYSEQEGQVENPTASYSYVFRSGDFQNIFLCGITQYTSKEIRKYSSAINNLYVGHTLVGSVGTTKLNYGMSSVASYSLYSKDYLFSDNEPKNKDNYDYAQLTGKIRPDMTFMVIPFLDYSISSRISLRTSYNGGFFYHYRGETQPTFYNSEATQSLGLGIAASRDIYLLPNIQWVWADIRSDKTNVVLTAIVSL